jgi:HAD superfamily hydrolase (TIGR01509 family)
MKGAAQVTRHDGPIARRAVRLGGSGDHGRIAGVLFDLDATLIGRRTANLARVASLLHARFGVGEECGPGAGSGNRVGREEQGGRSVGRRLLSHGYQHLRVHVVLDPTARDVLDTLQRAGVPFGIVTNGRAEKQHTLDLLGLRQRTSCLIVSETAGRRKPDPALFVRAAACLGVPPAQVLFVGDKLRHDIRGAHDAGMRTAWIQRGPAWLGVFRPARRHADVVLSSLADLVAVLDVPRGQGPAAG